MSATRDKSQKTTFVYSNLYQLYRKGKDEAALATGSTGQSAAAEPASAEPSYFAMPSERNVLKTVDLKREGVSVEPYTPPSLLGKRLEVARANPSSDSALSGLKQNLQSLQDLHSRLRFMLKELEELGDE
jgi:hypothetical protein